MSNKETEGEIGFLLSKQMLARKKLDQAMFMSVNDYSDILYMHAASSVLKMLDSLYHAALRFVSALGFCTHYCVLYEKVGCSSLYNRRTEHWYIFPYKAVLNKLPSYLCSLLAPKSVSSCNLRTHGFIMYEIPRTRSVFGKRAFNVFAPSS